MRLWGTSDICHKTESFKGPQEDFALCQSGDRDQIIEEKYPAATETNPTPIGLNNKGGRSVAWERIFH